jgi:hypothetical protein
VIPVKPATRLKIDAEIIQSFTVGSIESNEIEIAANPKVRTFIPEMSAIHFCRSGLPLQMRTASRRIIQVTHEEPIKKDSMR